MFRFDTLGELLQQAEGFEEGLSHSTLLGQGQRVAAVGTEVGMKRQELPSPSPVLQLLPFNAQRPGPEGRQLSRGIISFPSLLLLLLHRQAVSKSREAAFRPGEGERKGVNVTEAPCGRSMAQSQVMVSAEKTVSSTRTVRHQLGRERGERNGSSSSINITSAGQDGHGSMVCC